MTYLDSSVVLRHVLLQDDRLPLQPLGDCVASALLEVECHRALDRARLAQGLNEAGLRPYRESLRGMLRALRLVPLEPYVLTRACAPLPVPLGTLDACHLATALRLREDGETGLAVATHDRRLAEAARTHDFDVVGA